MEEEEEEEEEVKGREGTSLTAFQNWKQRRRRRHVRPGRRFIEHAHKDITVTKGKGRSVGRVNSRGNKMMFGLSLTSNKGLRECFLSRAAEQCQKTLSRNSPIDKSRMETLL